MPVQAFYAIPYYDWWNFFDPEAEVFVKRATKNSYVVHIWNKMVDPEMTVESDMPYGKMARDFCPIAWTSALEGRF